jgi:hypothetical protein
MPGTTSKPQKISGPGLVLPLLLLGVACHGAIALAQSPGTFTATGSMATPRTGHSATLLFNGKVLIAGGSPVGFGNGNLASAELYDPSTGAFTQTGSMTTPRAGHRATLLADGRVLITGGTSFELYDPLTGTFTPAGATNTAFGPFSIVTLADGRVLLTGCAIPCNAAAAELYDPATGRYATVGTPGAGGDTATLLVDGRALITGGCPADYSGTKAQLFDPGTGMFSFTDLMPTGCMNINTATLLLNGKVLVAGSDEYDWPADAALYDPAAGTFTNLGNTIGPHEFSTATLIPDGTVLIAGGQLPGGNGDARAELYMPTTGKFALAGSMSTGRHSYTATLLADGTVLIAGGYSLWPGATASAEVYRPSVLIPAPTSFSLSGDGKGQGAILHAGTPKIASPSDPAVAGEYLEVYWTGLSDGSVIPPQVSIGGRLAEVLWFGNTPGFAGLNQINVRVPSGVAPKGVVPVRLTYLSRPSNEVTIGVR